ILELILQNRDIERSIHPSINLGSKSNSIPKHTPPNHNRSSFKLQCSSINLSLKPSPFFFQAHFLPSDPNLLILVSSDHTTFFQSSTVQCWCFKAKSNLSLL